MGIAELQVDSIDKFEATIFLAEIVGLKSVLRHPRPLGMVIMDKHKCATHTHIAELTNPQVRLEIVGHYHSPLCALPHYVCPISKHRAPESPDTTV